MIYGDKWVIYWSDYMSDAYTYGTDIRFVSRDEVVVKNQLMPPGSTIKTWYSKTQYQLQRIEPNLPIIDGESEYVISTDIDTMPGENIFMRLLFYDKYDVEVGHIIVREKSKMFRCPMATYSYKVQLINGGVTHFTFHSFSIQEVVDGTESGT